jgi:hypothetical protein
MRWSLGLMVIGTFVITLGFVPIYFNGITIVTLEGAASLFAVGIFVFLVGLLIRKATRVFSAV